MRSPSDPHHEQVPPAPGDPADYEEVADGDMRWRFDRRFLASNWACTWGRGCKGIGDEPASELELGCCSIGAELSGGDEARNLSAMAAMIPAELFEHSENAVEGGIFADETRTSTRVVDGACIFLNRPGHPGGAGCALHLAALAEGGSPIDWKPSVCWQLPIRVDWTQEADGTDIATVRRWRREDWGDEGETMAWCCTEEPEAYVGDRPVIESLSAELEEIVGVPVYVELRRQIGARW